jgi:uncharacterized protein (TIGR04141 family)
VPHDRDEYTDKFGWIDRIRPIHGPALLQAVERHLAGRLAEGGITDLDLALPEIVDWSAITGFRYHFEARKKFWDPELRIHDYLNGLAHTRSMACNYYSNIAHNRQSVVRRYFPTFLIIASMVRNSLCNFA